MSVSKTQIDRLGDRLKGEPHTEADLRLLDEYRRSFGEAYASVLRILRQRGVFPTGRLAKSTMSIVEKLRRESLRLSQMQDIAGCRIVVKNILEQEQFLATLKADFPEASVIDRRDNPSHGYRAVHFIVEACGKPVEIQVRSSLQHLWAEVSEKSSDVLDPTIKYGGGPERWRNFLTNSSKSVAAFGEAEKACAKYVFSVSDLDASVDAFRKSVSLLHQTHIHGQDVTELQQSLHETTQELESQKLAIQNLRGVMEHLWQANVDMLTGAITFLDDLKRQKQ